MSASDPDAGPRVATPADADAIVATFASAFADDTVWGWAFQTPEQASVLWGLLVEGALQYPWLWVTPGIEAAALWMPPGGKELTPAGEERLEPAIRAAMPHDAANLAMAVIDRFGEVAPDRQPYYYLSVLGTHGEHRGQGLGMALVAANLERIDAEHLPAYLESTNPRNLDRYRRVGFVELGEFAVTDGGPVVTQMWREAR